jgi:hypothetical protein
MLICRVVEHKIMSDRDPIQKRLLEQFEYKDGSLFNRITGNVRKMGRPCGWKNNA